MATIAPADQANTVQAGDVVGDAEEVEPVEQRRHLSAGDRQAARFAEDRGDLGAVPGHDVALGRPPVLDELADHLAAALEQRVGRGHARRRGRS